MCSAAIEKVCNEKSKFKIWYKKKLVNLKIKFLGFTTIDVGTTDGCASLEANCPRETLSGCL